MNENRIIFHNPHVEIWFKKPLFHYLTKRKSLNKYEYLFDEVLKKFGKITVLIDGYRSSFPYKFFNNKFFAISEFYLWCNINKIPHDKVEVISSYDKLTEKDYLFNFLYGNLTSVSGKFNFKIDKYLNHIANTKAKKIFHCTHYLYSAEVGAKNLALAKPDFLTAENNLKKNSPFFNKYFQSSEVKFITLPFVPSSRFKKNNFDLRENKAVATGTMPYPIIDSAFNDFFKTDVMHPMRMEIYNNRHNIENILDCFISPIDESHNFNRLDKFLLKIPFVKSMVNTIKNSQKAYFSFNIVDLYNKYLMFVVPEEINDLPGIGFAEGMACGATLIAKNDAMYTDLGLMPGEHFIAFDGTYSDFVNKLRHYIQHPNEASAIGIRGYDFISTKLTSEKVANKFLEELFN